MVISFGVCNSTKAPLWCSAPVWVPPPVSQTVQLNLSYSKSDRHITELTLRQLLSQMSAAGRDTMIVAFAVPALCAQPCNLVQPCATLCPILHFVSHWRVLHIPIDLRFNNSAMVAHKPTRLQRQVWPTVTSNCTWQPYLAATTLCTPFKR